LHAFSSLGRTDVPIGERRGITGTHRQRPGLREALAACRPGDILAVTKLDNLARSVPDARDIVDELTARSVRLDLGGSVHDPTDPIGQLLFTVLSMIAEVEADLARARTREGMDLAKGQGPPTRQATQAQAHERGPAGRSGGPAAAPPPISPRCSTGVLGVCERQAAPRVIEPAGEVRYGSQKVPSSTYTASSAPCSSTAGRAKPASHWTIAT